MTALLTTNLPLLSSAPGGIVKLRVLIRDLAVKGRLVPQDRHAEPAHDALARIAAGRQKGAPRPTSSAVEEPYPVPSSWAWTTFDKICRIKGDLVRPEDYLDCAQVAPDCIEKGTGRLLERRTVRQSGIRGPNNKFVAGQILYSKIRPSLSKAVLVDFDGLCSADMYPIESLIHPRYQLLAMLSEMFLAQVRIAENRVKMPKLNQESLNAFAFPVPPLEEQHRIVAKVDELMALCDRLEAEQADAEAAHAKLVEALLASLTQARDAADFRASWQQLAEHFHTLFTTEASVEALKLAICQLGVSGRLVQPEAGRGVITKLVAQLAEHWKNRSPRRLALAAVPAGDQRFVLPSSWAWLHFGFLAETRLGKMLDAAKNKGELKPYLRNTNVQWNRFELNDLKELRLETSEFEEYAVNVGDLMICEGGEPGRCAVWRDESQEIYFQKAIHRARPLGGISADYLQICLRVDAASGVLSRLFTGATIKHLTGEKLERYSVPVPPPKEQRRIVAKVSELLALCDELKARIAAARAQHGQLAEALVTQAVAA